MITLITNFKYYNVLNEYISITDVGRRWDIFFDETILLNILNVSSQKI